MVMVLSLWQRLFPKTHSPKPRPHPSHLQVECLEDRVVPAYSLSKGILCNAGVQVDQNVQSFFTTGALSDLHYDGSVSQWNGSKMVKISGTHLFSELAVTGTGTLYGLDTSDLAWQYVPGTG